MEVTELNGEQAASASGKMKRFHNWKLIVAEATVAFLGFYVLNATTTRTPKFTGVLGALIGAVFLWLLIRELYGFAIDRQVISIPANRLVWFPVLSLGRRKICLADVRSITVGQPWYGFQVAKIAGDFGSDLLVFPTRAQRRRFTAIVEELAPHVAIYRSKTIRI